jgi:hypothetical protein
MFRSLISATALLSAAIGAAQSTPLPEAPRPPASVLWPSSTSLPPSTRLRIGTFDHPLLPQGCKVRELNEQEIVCSFGPHHATVFDRSEVAYIATGDRWDNILPLAGPIAGLGGISLGASVFCGVDGGPICKTPAVLGLSLLATAITFQAVRVHRGHVAAKGKAIYLAPAIPRRSGRYD